MIAIQSLWGRRLFAGIVSWLVPFLVAIPFYSPSGGLLVDLAFFKAVMYVTGAVTAGLLLVWFFGKIGEGYVREGIILGIVLLGINWALDLVVLVGLLHTPLPVYSLTIGLSYLVIPVFTLTAGVVAENAKNRPAA